MFPSAARVFVTRLWAITHVFVSPFWPIPRAVYAAALLAVPWVVALRRFLAELVVGGIVPIVEVICHLSPSVQGQSADEQRYFHNEQSDRYAEGDLPRL